MGSTKLQIPTAFWWWLILLVAAIAPTKAAEMNTPTDFPDSASVEKWAAASFFGGFEKHAFEQGDKTVLVIIGMPTSGIVTSEIVVLEKRQGGAFSLILLRRKMPGLVTVKNTEDSIVFSTRTPILILPWTGVAVGMQK
jgi:hypothetical protein